MGRSRKEGKILGLGNVFTDTDTGDGRLVSARRDAKATRPVTQHTSVDTRILGGLDEGLNDAGLCYEKGSSFSSLLQYIWSCEERPRVNTPCVCVCIVYMFMCLCTCIWCCEVNLGCFLSGAIYLMF